ncbi:MAG: hypothetical protein JO227_06515, partial [Acetobacteraceae bacterium]|nr:hypothetical protein [Acetobacteraceae bacterium]
MRRLSGQAARILAAILYRLAQIAVAATVLIGVLVIFGAWRLSQGPVPLPWLSSRLESEADAPGSPVRIGIGATALAWEGFRHGVNRPLDLRLSDLRITDSTGAQTLTIPRAEISLSLRALLRGRLRPSAIELDGPKLVLRREPDGAIKIDLGGSEGSDSSSNLTDWIAADMARPPSINGAGDEWWSEIRLLRVRGAALTIVDRPTGATVEAPQISVELGRAGGGGITGTADANLRLGNESAQLTASASISPRTGATHAVARLGTGSVAALAMTAPV